MRVLATARRAGQGTGWQASAPDHPAKSLRTYVRSRMIPQRVPDDHLVARRDRVPTPDFLLGRAHCDLVDVAPDPVLTALHGLDDRMLGGVEVLGGVPVPRVVAAPDVAAGLAEAEVDPGVAALQTLLAPLRGPRGDVRDLVEVATGCCGCHECSPSRTVNAPSYDIALVGRQPCRA